MVYFAALIHRIAPNMAREAHDREDLLREATALVERVELSLPDAAENIVAGFRRDGSLSIYFGGDPVYQFNSAGELRRAFVDEVMYKAELCRLVALHRQRTERESALVRRELTEDQQSLLLGDAAARIGNLARHLEAGKVHLIGQVPPEGNVAARLRQVIESLPAPPKVAAGPQAR